MATKPTKSWGTLGGLVSTSRSYSVPSGGPLAQFWKTDDDYTEQTFTTTSGEAPVPSAPGYSPDMETMTWYEVTVDNGGGPATTTTIRTHTAHKIHHDNDGQDN